MLFFPSVFSSDRVIVFLFYFSSEKRKINDPVFLIGIPMVTEVHGMLPKIEVVFINEIWCFFVGFCNMTTQADPEGLYHRIIWNIPHFSSLQMYVLPVNLQSKAPLCTQRGSL